MMIFITLSFLNPRTNRETRGIGEQRVKPVGRWRICGKGCDESPAGLVHSAVEAPHDPLARNEENPEPFHRKVRDFWEVSRLTLAPTGRVILFFPCPI